MNFSFCVPQLGEEQSFVMSHLTNGIKLLCICTICNYILKYFNLFFVLYNKILKKAFNRSVLT